MPEELLPFVVAGLLLIISLLFLAMFLMLARSWFRAFLSGVPVRLTQIIGMRLRGSPSALLIDALIMLRHRGHDVTIHEVETSYLAYRERVHSPGDLADLVLRLREEAETEKQAR
jgi:uncharacterized protein YqfA (UPF0365 family)